MAADNGQNISVEEILKDQRDELTLKSRLEYYKSPEGQKKLGDDLMKQIFVDLAKRPEMTDQELQDYGSEVFDW